jgi:hypothetical protein
VQGCQCNAQAGEAAGANGTHDAIKIGIADALLGHQLFDHRYQQPGLLALGQQPPPFVQRHASFEGRAIEC